MKKNLFPTILISVLVAFWGLILFGYDHSEAIVINKTNATSPNLKNGLVGHWTFDGRDMTSNTSTDRSGQGNHGTTTLATAKIGKIGQSLNFNGSTSFVNIGDSASLRVTNQYTISTWVKIRAHKNYNQVLMKNNSNSSYYGLIFGVGGEIQGQIGNGGSFVNPLGTRIMAVNKWYHTVITYDSSLATDNLKFFIDGVRDPISSGSGNFTLGAGDTTGVNATIGKDAVNGRFFDGSIDDTRIYNRALSPAEIVQLYTMGGDKINKTDVVRAQLRSGLIGHWTMDGADTTVNTSTDRSGYGNHGTRSTTSTVMTIGRIGQAAKFVSTNNNYIKMAANDPLFNTGATGTFSYSFWIKSNSFSGTVLSKSHSCANEGHFNISASGQAISLAFYSDLDAATIIYSSGNILTTGKWNYVTITKQWGTANATKLYVNGEQKTFTPDGSDSVRGTTYTDLKEYIGAQVDIAVCSGADGPVARVFNGSIDEVRIYNRILPPAEVVELYKMGGGVVNKSSTVAPALKNGLLAHWTFDGSSMTHNTTTDSSGNRNDAFLLASVRPLVGIGKIGQGMKFDGSSRIGRIATSSSLGPLGNTATISYWIKSDNLSTGLAEVMFAYGNASQYPDGLMFYKVNRTLNVYWKAAGPITSLPDFFTTSTWVHILMTNDNGTMNIYKDSVWYAGPGTTGGSITNPTFNYFIGGEDNGGWFTRGILDDLRVYNRVLTGAEIERLYSMGR